MLKTKLRKSFAVLTALLLLLNGFAAFTQVATAMSGENPDDGPQMIEMCQATGSEENPYTSITVNSNRIIKRSSGNGYSVHPDNIIPPFPDFEGKNWDTEGQEIFKNDCALFEPVNGEDDNGEEEDDNGDDNGDNGNDNGDNGDNGNDNGDNGNGDQNEEEEGDDPEEVQSIFLNATKVICEDESDLPKWGDSPGLPEDPFITPEVINTWVNENDACDFFEDEWHFQWAYGSEDNPGDNQGIVDDEKWNLFSSEDTVEIYPNDYSTLAVREVMREGFLPFSDDLQDDYSAEFYCHDDVYNYDNLEYIQNLEPGQTYHCAGFNVQENQVFSEMGEVDDLFVDYGTSEGDAISELDDEVEVTSETGETETAQIEDWEIEDYDGDNPGDYNATGMVVLPSGWILSSGAEDPSITATVTVGDPPSSRRSGQRVLLPSSPPEEDEADDPEGEVLGEADLPEGEVLGEMDQRCEPYLTQYIRPTAENDFEQVRKLQQFLNEYREEDLNVTGVYGGTSIEAVKRLQADHAEDILTPWGLEEPTGFVYKTTLRFINKTKCPDKSFPMPDLVPASESSGTPPLEVLGE